MPPLVLFDLGDTLIYRIRPLVEYDIDLVCKLFNKNRGDVKPQIESLTYDHPGIYRFGEESIKSLYEEQNHDRIFFEILLKQLRIFGLKELELLLTKRAEEQRYFLFDNVKNLLNSLKSDYRLGVLTNGRPSRRITLKMLGLIEYFEAEQINISDEIGMTKPDPDLYRYIMDRSGTQEIYLCDDEDINLEPSKLDLIKGIKVDHKNGTGFTNVINQLIKK